MKTNSETMLYSNAIYIPQPVAYFRIGNVIGNIYKKEDVPNRFHRFMQEKILGIKWEIVKEN